MARPTTQATKRKTDLVNASERGREKIATRDGSEHTVRWRWLGSTAPVADGAGVMNS
jgi:hypothetical protein